MNMVALLRPQPEIAIRPRQLRLVTDNGQLVDGHAPDLHALDRERTSSVVRSSSGRRSKSGVASVIGAERMVMVAVVAAALVVFGGLALIRSAQGGPTAQSWAGVDTAASGSVGGVGAVGTAAMGAGVVAAPGDLLYVAKPGDSMWSIAQTLAPDSDPRPVVAALIEANGDDSLQIGQQIVIPEQLLD